MTMLKPVDLDLSPFDHNLSIDCNAALCCGLPSSDYVHSVNLWRPLAATAAWKECRLDSLSHLMLGEIMTVQKTALNADGVRTTSVEKYHGNMQFSPARAHCSTHCAVQHPHRTSFTPVPTSGSIDRCPSHCPLLSDSDAGHRSVDGKMVLLYASTVSLIGYGPAPIVSDKPVNIRPYNRSTCGFVAFLRSDVEMPAALKQHANTFEPYVIH